MMNADPKTLTLAATILEEYCHGSRKDQSELLGLASNMRREAASSKLSASEQSRELSNLIDACRRMLLPIDCQEYPMKDVYGSNGKKGKVGERDIDMPFWSEAGLYPRVGKEAARTLLGRYENLRETLTEFLAYKSTKEKK